MDADGCPVNGGMLSVSRQRQPSAKICDGCGCAL